MDPAPAPSFAAAAAPAAPAAPAAAVAPREVACRCWLPDFNITQSDIDDQRDFVFSGDYTEHPRKQFFNELKKRISYDTRECLYGNKDEKMRLLNSNMSLAEMMECVGNITSTHLAVVLAGRQHVQNVDDPTLVVSDDSVELKNRKHRIAVEAHEMGPTDFITAFELSKKGNNTQNSRAFKGESALFLGLTKNMNISKYRFETQEQQQDRMILSSGIVDKPTPDILFKVPLVLFGQTIHWIDAKNSLVVRGLSPDKIIDSLSKQMKNYTDTFGPGAVLWTKCGFSKCTQEWLQSEFGVLCLRQLGNVPYKHAMNDSAKDITIRCQTCHVDFNFPDKQQREFKLKGFKKPKRCPSCPKR
jgi:hypothetical protein